VFLGEVLGLRNTSQTPWVVTSHWRKGHKSLSLVFSLGSL